MQLKGAFKMKKFVSLLLALMMALGMTALAEESKDQLARIQEKGEIVIATEGTWAPWTYTDENGNLVGFDVEIATAIAEKLGVKATFVTVEWDGILAGIDSGRYDIAANGSARKSTISAPPMPSTARRWSSGATTRTSSPLKT